MPGQNSASGPFGFADSIENWMAQRNADVQRLAAGAHAVGQQVWRDGNRLSQYVSAARPSDVATLGIRAMQKAAATGDRLATGASDAVVRQVAAMSPAARRIASSVGDAGLAGLNGAQDAFTFGVGDRAYAGIRALADAAQGDNLARSYSRHYAGTQALDAYDEAHHPIARTLGQLAGTGAQIALLGVGEGAIAARTIKHAAPMVARELAAIGGAGGVAGTRAAPFCCREFPDNWLVVFSEDFDWASPKRLIDLSRLGFAVACKFEDKVEMTSSLTAARDGVELWRVFHDNTQSIFRLDVSGEPPAALAAIRDKAFEEQRADGGEESSTDFVHDVPLELGRVVCGFHAEEVDAPFTALRKASASGIGGEGKPRGLLGKLLSLGRG